MFCERVINELIHNAKLSRVLLHEGKLMVKRPNFMVNVQRERVNNSARLDLIERCVQICLNSESEWETHP